LRRFDATPRRATTKGRQSFICGRRTEAAVHALREYEKFYNSHRPHQGMANARPLHALPQPGTDRAGLARLDIHRRQRSSDILNEYYYAV
jgi:hypothetical protein